MTDIRCAVLGLGRLGYRHTVNLATKVRGAKLVAVSDVIPEVTERVARELDVPIWTTNPEELIERDDIDAFIVVTPNDTHAMFATKVAQAGKQLFLEKPLSTSMEEAIEVVKVVKENSIYCQLGFMRRYDPAYTYAKNRIQAGDIGKPLYFKGITRDPKAPPENFIAASGGIFLDQSIHDFDIARYLMGQEVTEVTAIGSILYSKVMEKYNDVDQAITYLRFTDGASGDVEAYRNAFYGYDVRAEVIGTEGTLFIAGLQHHNVSILKPNQSSHDIVPGFLERFEDAYLIELEAFIQHIQDGQPSEVTAYDGYAALAIGTAARKSQHDGRPVKVNLTERG
jgi:scyllo-inositol 2-dehydrogenase (NAD+)